MQLPCILAWTTIPLEVARSEVIRSKINWKEAAKYICLASSPADWDRWGVKKLIPRRAKVGDSTPGIRGAEVLGADTGSKQWEFKNLEPTKKQIKHL